MENFKKCVERVHKGSKDASVFVLLHKMDKVSSDSKARVI